MGRWAKNNDQRKGQWLYNMLRPTNIPLTKENIDDYKRMIADKLFNISNEEFEIIMARYYLD
jgi:uncharacterized protein (DUF1015 family)